MDVRGNIHRFTDDLERQRLEILHGKLVEIPETELPEVEALSITDRQAWYRARATAEQKRERKEKRKRQRAARKANRRVR